MGRFRGAERFEKSLKAKGAAISRKKVLKDDAKRIGSTSEAKNSQDLTKTRPLSQDSRRKTGDFTKKRKANTVMRLKEGQVSDED